MRSSVLLLAVAACARGSASEPAAVDAAATGDEPVGDASSQMHDAPSQMGTCTMGFTGALATWDLAGAAGTQAMTPVTATAHGVTGGALSRSAGLTAVTGANSINSSNWSTAAQLDATKYYAVALSPPAGCTIALAKINLDARASGTGPAMVALATSADAYATTTPVTTGAASSVAMTAATPSMIEVRIYGWAATGTAGTLRIQNTLTIDGELR